MEKSSNEKIRASLEVFLRKNRKSMVEDVMELSRIRSVSGPREENFPFGAGCAMVLDKAAEIARRRGFHLENHEYYSASAVLPGKSKRTIGIFGHLDIVPEGDGWTTPPFEPVVKDGHIFGRGPGDNKGPSVAALCLFQFIKEQGLPFDHSLMLWYGVNEEAGMEDIKWYLNKYGAPEVGIVPDGTFPVCIGEKGRFIAEIFRSIRGSNIISFSGGTAVNVVPETASIELAGIEAESASQVLGENFSYEATPEGVRISARGIPAHAMNPEKGLSAIHILTKAISQTCLAGDKGRRILAALAAAFDSPWGEGLGIAYEDEISGKLTSSGGLIKIEDGILVQTLQCRYPVTADKNTLLKSFTETMTAAGFSVNILSQDDSRFLPPDTPLAAVLTQTFKEFFHEDLPPFVSGGGTYAGKLPHAVAFGARLMSRYRPGGDTRGGGHQADECVSIEGLEDMIRVYLLSLLKVDKL